MTDRLVFTLATAVPLIGGVVAEVYGYDMGSEIVGTVAMPDALIELLEAFVAEHHVEEPFVKRQRQKHHRAEEHKFGQEPIEMLRQRRGRREGEE